MSDTKYLDQFSLPRSATEAMAKAVPSDVVQAIVQDNMRRWAPTPPKPKSVVDELVEKFNPKGD